MAPFFLFFLLLTTMAPGSDPGQRGVVNMPAPSGPFAVGRTTYDWTDPARPETLAKGPKTAREILVDVWYPAAPVKPGTATEAYLPGAEKIDKSEFAQAEKRNWGSVWRRIAGGGVHIHAYENAAIAPGDARFPVIIFSPAISGEACAYTHQIEELASRGYVVASVHHTYEVTVTLFPDGRMIPFSQENFRRYDNSQTAEEARAWEHERIEVWAGDIGFTLDQLLKLDKAPFRGRLDRERVAVVGHSFGGIAAARACELDSRFKACVNQDGIGIDGPIMRFQGGHMPAQPYLFLRSMSGPGTDTSNKDGREQAAQIAKELADCRGSTTEVRIGTAGFRHSSYTDIPWLQAEGDARDTARALQALAVIEGYTLAFLDKNLKGAKDTLLDRPPRTREVRVSRWHQ
jgi:pimeloyl-ACP methyl ester carboxylesterase